MCIFFKSILKSSKFGIFNVKSKIMDLLLTQGNVPKLFLPENTNIILSEGSDLLDENATVIRSAAVKANPPKVFHYNYVILLKNSNAHVFYICLVYCLGSTYTAWVSGQPCPVKMAGRILASFFVCLWTKAQ